MTSKAKDVLNKIEAQDHWMIVGPARGRVLADEVRNKKPNKILEVGTYIGYSSILIANSAAGSNITTIEISKDNAQVAKENIKNAGLEERIDVIVGDAKEIIPTLKDTYDFVFLDAKKQEYLAYLKSAEEKLEKGSVIVADNVGIYKESMRDYLKYVRESGNYESLKVKVGSDALEISIKSF